MRYLILYENKAFFTKWYKAEDHYKEGMVVIDMGKDMYSTDGKNFLTIPGDPNCQYIVKTATEISFGHTFNPETFEIVIDICNDLYTIGQGWQEIEMDHL